jgi:small membrane protein
MIINVIQTIIIVAAVFIAFYALGQRNTHSGKASKKIVLILLAIGMVVAVIFPDTITALANMVGVGRGTDLLLYVTVLVFIFYVLNGYLQQQDQRDALFRLARRVAIIEAKEKHGNFKSQKEPVKKTRKTK